MKIKRVFTKDLQDPYAGLAFVARTTLEPATGKAWEIVAPATWSDTAVSILAHKYCFRDREHDARQLFGRLAEAWTRWGAKLGYFSSSEDASVFRDEILYMLAHQIASPNSPQWFNTGLHEAYGLKGDPRGHWFIDDKGAARPSPDAFSRPQAHACFIQSVRDDLVGAGGIFDLLTREARLFKHGAGSGTNFSSLRGKGEPLFAGGHSSGLLSFLRIGDTAAAAVESGGTTRRAAKMVVLDLDHPDVEEFISWKALEEEKVASLITGSHQSRLLWEEIRHPDFRGSIEGAARKYGVPSVYAKTLKRLTDLGWAPMQELTTDWRGGAYATVSGQYSNNSLRVPDRFFDLLDANGDWTLKLRTGEAKRSIKAQDLWRQLGTAAWLCADPGLQFSDTIAGWHTCPSSGEIRASNPCAEYLFLDDTGCNLASLNLLKFYDPKNRSFDVNAFQHTVRLWSLVLEITVAMAQFPTEEIAINTDRFRTLGLGYANLGALFMVMGQGYADDASRKLAAAISSLLTAEAYATSAECASEKGAFAAFDENREPMLAVISRHLEAHRALMDLESNPGGTIQCLLESAGEKSWARALDLGRKHGFRNAQASAIAPTGTIGLLMDCDTLGIEPEYLFAKQKSLAGGGSLIMQNASLVAALENLGYSGDKLTNILGDLHSGLPASRCRSLEAKHYGVFACSEEIAWQDHLWIVSAVQPFVSGGISKTVNLPESASPEDILSAYRMAWREGIKCVSVFRRGSKMSQPWIDRLEECAVCS